MSRNVMFSRLESFYLNAFLNNYLLAKIKKMELIKMTHYIKIWKKIKGISGVNFKSKLKIMNLKKVIVELMI